MANKVWTEEELNRLAQEFEEKTPQEILEWAIKEFHPNIAFACSFGAEDVALVDMIVKINPETRIFYLDTNLLFKETYETIERVKERYRISPVRYSPALTLEEQAERYGDKLWEKDPNLCCKLRKVEPLKEALKDLAAWITGIRREQSPTRANAKTVEWDKNFGLVKVNPIVRWTTKDVWDYIMEHKVPYNPLHDRNYPSIGCEPCTRPVKPGEDPRAGRWAGFQKKECGLHGEG